MSDSHSKSKPATITTVVMPRPALALNPTRLAVSVPSLTEQRINVNNKYVYDQHLHLGHSFKHTLDLILIPRVGSSAKSDVINVPSLAN
jgi:hypothetical protein